MTILSTLQSAHIQSRKNREKEKTIFLSTLISEASQAGKRALRDSTDDEVIATLKKFISNNEETISRITDKDQIGSLNNEIKICKEFLPVQMTAAQLELEIKTIVSSEKNMGKIMAQLKQKFAGLYDGTEAAKLIKKELSAQ